MPYFGLYIPAKGGLSSSSAATTALSPSSSLTVKVNGIASSVTGATANGNGNDSAAANGGIPSNSGASGDHNSSETPYVFSEKLEALEVLKMHKDARLREFSNEDDAVKYAQTGYEVVQSKYTDVKTSTANLEKATFRAPTKQELVEFRKMIESGDYERVKSVIWDNPRYLVSSGDTPTTLKEGYRYNAMHVCAISKKPRIADLILQTVSDTTFVDLLTGKKNDEKMCKELCSNLLDYYLNIPEKGRSETPLHFAAKNGCIEMIKVLTSYPECKMTPNSEGALPKDIICSRAPQSTPELCNMIAVLLEDRFYVPVLCSMDSAIPPQVGEPFSATNPPNLNCDLLSPEVKIQALAGPMSQEKAKKFCRRWKTPPRIGSNASSPIVNNPYISPRKGRYNSRTPTRSTTNISDCSPTSSLQRRTLFNSTTQASLLHQNSNAALCENIENLSLIDKQNGNESDVKEFTNTSVTSTIGTSLQETNNNEDTCASDKHSQPEIMVAPTKPINSSSSIKSSLCPNTPMLKMKMDLFFTYRDQNQVSPFGMESPNIKRKESNLNSLFGGYDPFETPGYKERHIKITDTEKGLEIIGRELAKEQNVEWREYWDFLSDFINIATAEGLQKFENFFAQRIKEAERAKKCTKTNLSPNSLMNDVSCALEKLCCSKDVTGSAMAGRNGLYECNRSDNYFSNATVLPLNSGTTSAPVQSTTPYTCVEKSLQVFAKRMTKTIISNMENVVSINDTLISELKRLKSLICSFKDDMRFSNVNFSKVHSRFGNLISIYLINSMEVSPEIKTKVLAILENLVYTLGERREHVECVCSRILAILKQSRTQTLPENLKTEEMCKQAWEREQQCECQWETSLSRKTSRRQRMESRYKNHQIKQQENKDRQDIAKFANKSITKNNETSDDSDEDVFWSDFGTSEAEDDDVWFTPPGSPSLLSLVEDEGERYEIFVYGNEPTKRDLDVLNAIFHIEIDQKKYPNIYAWKTALSRYPNEEMDYFPSPAVIKKSHSFTTKPLTGMIHCQTPHHHKQVITNIRLKSTPEIYYKQQTQKDQQLPIAKRLFMSPSHHKSMSCSTQPTVQRYTTPPSKMRGLFTIYRECKDNSPASGSSGDTE